MNIRDGNVAAPLKRCSRNFVIEATAIDIRDGNVAAPLKLPNLWDCPSPSLYIRDGNVAAPLKLDVRGRGVAADRHTSATVTSRPH